MKGRLPSVITFAIALAVTFLVTTAFATGQDATPPAAPTFMGAAACQDCHEDIWRAWNKTKHAGTFEKLADSDRADASCVSCHATGTPETLAAEGRSLKLPGAQCESCHGPASQHVDRAKKDPKAPGLTLGLEKVPSSATCQKCHNAKSPHFKGFFYAQMKELVHKVRSRERGTR